MHYTPKAIVEKGYFFSSNYVYNPNINFEQGNIIEGRSQGLFGPCR